MSGPDEEDGAGWEQQEELEREMWEDEMRQWLAEKDPGYDAWLDSIDERTYGYE